MDKKIDERRLPVWARVIAFTLLSGGASVFLDVVIRGRPIDYGMFFLLSVIGASTGFVYHSFNSKLDRLNHNLAMAMEKQVENSGKTHAVIDNLNLVAPVLDIYRSEIQYAYFQAIKNLTAEVGVQNNILKLPSEWLSLKAYVHMWGKLKEAQALMRSSRVNSNIVVWITHCGPVDILLNADADKPLIDGNQQGFQENDGVVARILVNQGNDGDERYENAIRKMQKRGAHVFYIDNARKHLDAHETTSDFLAARIPQNKVGVRAGTITLQWVFDANRRHIVSSEISDDSEVAKRKLAQWERMIEVVLDQEEASDEPTKHLCDPIPAPVLSQLSRQTRNRYNEVVEAKNLPFAE